MALFFEKGYKKPVAEIAKAASLNMDFQTKVVDIIQMENLDVLIGFTQLNEKQMKKSEI